MSIIQIQATLTNQDLLKATEQLNSAELKELMQQLSTLYAQRQIPHLSKEEAELLQKINQSIPLAIWEPYKALITQRDTNSLTPDKHQELIQLTDQIEILNAERMKYLVELAQLRNIPLTDLMDELGIHPQNHA